VVQHHNIPKLAIFKTETIGWGLKAKQYIKKGQYITRYTGEIIEKHEAMKRENSGSKYLLDLDFFNDGQSSCLYSIDAENYGNESRFINHSCNPNAEIKCVWIENWDPHLPNIAIFASKDIECDEEITFDYKFV
ncbi:MAG: Initiation factor eIF2 gamma, C terminal, partial [Paramarteilia canceri]